MYIRVRVNPSAKKERVEEAKNGDLLLSVRDPAEQNRANTRVREIVAARFGVPVGKVRIISGHRSSGKVLSVDLPCEAEER
ncbi:MAG: hypothetical protein COZ49_01090 [Candidatus Yonathbacteria bacterium CG_4_10_14_3_um_filter_47_65]|uniref:Uncharacterized protein n=2 Tax=Parcubacteria group TaxID=1794811 RepID=A0A2M8D9C3_9BACT|nr:MAG: hypothetical protein AUJ44_03045 [Candidatus Nomurabacteria bacterium CG1_02_47_685]PIP03948.1 MAG: hypothetical protein COX54_01470 [Candidatus Yonathbacteria bacterium CG23_combo_of_CG06-09_8_20_14_all_46_18]PIQ33245.1 MAG: hypothetical protein COW61_00305 [Candidatus Yonathbacteria bacterium CG17_big_fil_post_rev_8_21_14_2_50_46_19]PIX56563.1 MAG: hypothetical protein COZ49_01090 [Candidatus Yonathbacteria bacterium CG_4_10_14_3_um_filter_47_65]PIY57440.1 MAG: hypothetical protein CO